MSTILKHAASAVRTPFLHTGCFHVIDTNSFLKARLSARSRNLVQDLYLKELRIYKAPPVVRTCIYPNPPPAPINTRAALQAKDAHVGAVKAFSVPIAPSVPTLPDLATELAAYDSTEPTRADATDVSPVHGGPAAGAEAYLAFLEADEVQEEAHH
ncbi:hypothetical protein EDB92DRAFT_1819967 [Lactarius akahatsu]|uniref:Uncharacterized protein n=1 Tax=Lactarius akahatsu TaxID=416441 RepID=A0AAD4LAC4_9AGAM|nr:hypothetical protein EDB92DRAFT_1819967 [Lactarius akahatsu]